MTNADNAVITIAEFETEFQSIETTSMNTLMEAFIRISQKHGGQPFKSFPGKFTLPNPAKGPDFEIYAHAAVFENSSGEIAFAAALFEPNSGEFAGVQSNAPMWPEWLDTIVRQIHSGVVEALRSHPGASSTKH